MTEAADPQFAQLVRMIAPHSRLLRAWPLKGGVSAQVTALELARPDGQRHKLIVRRHGAVDRTHNPHVAADEFKLLERLRSAGLATPRPYYLDQSGTIFPEPYVVIEYIEGAPEFAPTDLDDYLLQLATHLARIHAVDCAHLDVSFLRHQENISTNLLRTRPAHLDTSLEEGRIRDTLAAVWPLPQRNRSGLLHGDFWPGNLVWKDGRLVGIIDWEDAQIGDPLADVGNTRLELVWAFGIDAMYRFTQQYLSMTSVDCTNLPYWDLCAALRPASKIAAWAGDDSTEKRMRAGHRLFITQAFAKLSAHHSS